MPRARYKALVDSLAADIREGRLAPGTCLPPHRRLAARHRLGLATATRVYAELRNMGLVTGEPGRGTFVRDALLPQGHGTDQPAPVDGTADLAFNYPSLPRQSELLRDALRRIAASGDLDSLLRYQPHSGRPHERATVAAHIARYGLAVRADQVSLVSGGQQGLAVVAMALLRAGDVVAVDALTYPGFKVVAEAMRLELAPLPAGRSGPDLEALAALCRRRRVRAVYVMPTLHNPLGWVTPMRARRDLVALARTHDLLVVEDAAYAFLADRPPPPVASLAPERTVYVSSFSKNVATGLRVGLVAAPVRHVADIERAIRATTWNTASVMTAIACGWIQDGTVARLEVEKRRDARLRQSIAAEALRGLRLVTHASSYFVWLPLPAEVRAHEVTATLARRGVSVSTAEPFAARSPVPQALRLALGSVPVETLRTALRTVADVVGSHAA